MASPTNPDGSLALSLLGLLRGQSDFRRLWLGALVSMLGDHLTWMALTWHVVEKTGSGAAVGTLLLCFAIPAALSASFWGKLLDRFSPRRVMVWDNIARAVLVFLIPLLIWQNRLPLPLLYSLAGLVGALSPITQIGARLFVPRLSAGASLETANAAFALTEQIPTVAGPAIAGLIIAAGGAPFALVVDALTFLAMAALLATLPDLPRPAPSSATTAGSGPTMPSASLWRYPVVVIVTLLSAVFYFSYGPTEAAMPLFVKNHLHADARGLGLLWSSVGVGSVIGTLGTGWLARRFPVGPTLAVIALLWGIFEALLGSSPTLPLAALCFFAGGIVWGPYIALRTTLVQRVVPENRWGAILGQQTAFLTPTAPLGTALGGLLLQSFPAPTVIKIAGLACVVAGSVALCLPALRRVG